MAELLYRVGRAASRHARAVIATWVAVLVLVGVAYGVGGGTLGSAFSIPGTPTAEVTDRLRGAFPEAAGGTGSVVLRTEDGSAFTARQRDAVARLAADAADLDGVETVLDPFASEAQRTAQQQQVDEGRAQVEAGRTRVEAGREQLAAALAQLDASRTQLDAARAQAVAGGAPPSVLTGLDAQGAQLDEGRTALERQRDELEAQATELETGATTLEQGARLLEMTTGIRTVSEDGSTAVLTVVFTEEQMEVPDVTKAAVVSLVRDAAVDGVRTDVSADLSPGVPSILGAGEVVGLAVAAVALAVMLGTLVGAGLPILTALLGVGIGAGGALSLSGVVDMASVTPVLGVMLGLAVGIDYALFIVNRHRRQLMEGYDVEESIGLANGTSGGAVVFAGATVLIALLALNVTGIPFLGLMGSVGAFCVAVAVLIAVTLTPALLGLARERILRRAERARLASSRTAGTRAAVDAGATAPALRPMSTWRAWGRVVVGVLMLAVVALPALDLRVNLPDGSSEPHDSTQYRAYATVAEELGEGQNGPLLVVADLPGTPTEADAVAAELEIAEVLFAQDDVVAVAPIGTSADRTVAAFQVVPADGPTSESTEALVHRLRELSPVAGEYAIGVAGSASGNIDISATLSDALPVYLAVVIGLSLIILVLVFRSVFVPVIATLGFILSYFAALGGVVAIYQWGWLSAFFGVESPGPVLNFLPTLLVGILFGLAMDYMLFLGSGMREAYTHGVPARLAVVQGVRAGRAVVTAAAVIMIAVFGGFVFSHSAMIRPIGFALAFGVLVDAFVVRMLLIPALMHLAGDRAWWLPRWLDRLLPDVDVEGAALERRHPHAAHADAPVAHVGAEDRTASVSR